MANLHARIMLLGRTGVGKSSLINYLLDSDICQTGRGEPVTQGFLRYDYILNNTLPIEIYDSKGLEVVEFQKQREEIKNYIASCCQSENIYDWIHTIFYCINIERSRLEDSEIEFIKGLQAEISHTIHVILTHCQSDGEDEKSRHMMDYVHEVLGDNVEIYCVNSVEEKRRKGVMLQFGREKVLCEIVRLLWKDIIRYIAGQLDEMIRQNMFELLDLLHQSLASYVERITVKEILQHIGHLDELISPQAISQCVLDLQRYMQRLQDGYQEKLAKWWNFCNEYALALGYEDLNLNDMPYWDEQKLSSALEDIFEESEWQESIVAIDKIGKGFQETLNGLFFGVSIVFNAKKRIKKLVDNIILEMEKAIPDKGGIAEEIYLKLAGDIKNN